MRRTAGELELVVGVEGGPEGGHLVGDAPQRPHVRLLRVPRALDLRVCVCVCVCARARVLYTCSGAM